MKKYKVVIIGSGIAGMTAGIYLKRGGINPLIIENKAPGGELNIIPKIENYPGYLSVSGPDLAMGIYNQVNNLNIDYLFRNIKSIDLNKKIIDEEFEYDYLIIATGRRPRMLCLENEEKLIGRGVSTCALCDGNFYKDKVVAVVGGGDSALTESLYLASICRKVKVIVRGSFFKGEKYLIDKVKEKDNIEIIYNSNVTKYLTENDKLVGIVLNEDRKVCVDGVFLSIGSTPNGEMFDVDKDGDYILVNNNYETSKSDVYAIGDVIKKEVYQLTTATAEASYVASMIIKKER